MSGLSWPPQFGVAFEEMMERSGLSHREGELLHFTEFHHPAEEVLSEDLTVDLSQARAPTHDVGNLLVQMGFNLGVR